MSWLDSVAQLAVALESQSERWICFLQCESSTVFRHPNACDHSLGSSKNGNPQLAFDPASAIFEDMQFRCFFAPEPIVDCQEFVAQKFFEHPKVRERASALFLIPYFSLDDFKNTQAYPFLKFVCPEFIEIRGTLKDELPQIRGQGRFFEDFYDLKISEKDPLQSSTLKNKKSKASSERVADNRPETLLWQGSESSESIHSMFINLKDLMRRGECYLANASTRIMGPSIQDAQVHLSDFVTKWIDAPARFGVFVQCGDQCPRVVCYSPERFISRQGCVVQTEPIKGTAPLETESDLLGSYHLWNSNKEMFEQKMVCDLLRNDMHKVCRPGSVRVVSPFEIKPAGSLLQMQSTIVGVLEKRDLTHIEILEKMLPAGSISGTPKHAVGRILKSLEKTPRGYYTGVFAIADDENTLDSTILIRGFFSDLSNWYAGIGSGITVLSDVEQEALEFELKWASFLERWPSSQKSKTSLPSAVEATQGDDFELGLRGSDFREKISREKFFDSLPFELPEHNCTRQSLGLLFELKTIADLERHRDLLEGSILFVDHQDSFSENLIAALRMRGCHVARVTSVPNEKCIKTESSDQFEDLLRDCVQRGCFSVLVLSPGPGRPIDYRFSQNLLAIWPSQKPVLGVCLGHQMLLMSAGCQLELVAESPVHGRAEQLSQVGAFRWLPAFDFLGSTTFYNSWCVTREEFQTHALSWELCLVTDQSVALCEHKVFPWVGVQFHPESFASESGAGFLDAFVAMSSTIKIACDK